MKLGRTSWIIIVLGVVIVAFASMWLTRSNQSGERDQVTEELSIAQTRLDAIQLKQLTTQKSDLDAQLAVLTAQTGIAKAKLVWQNQSIPITDFLFKIASDSGVTIIGIQSSGLTKEKLAGVNCTSIGLDITAEGEVPKLLTFISKLNGNFTTGIVSTVGIRISEPSMSGLTDNQTSDQPLSENTTLPAAQKPSVNVRLTIYNYEGG